jgi:hypothetical protein
MLTLKRIVTTDDEAILLLDAGLESGHIEVEMFVDHHLENIDHVYILCIFPQNHDVARMFLHADYLRTLGHEHAFLGSHDAPSII